MSRISVSFAVYNTLGLVAVDIERFLAERERAREECVRLDELVSRYKKEMPDLVPKWDTSPASISFNDINADITASGPNIYICKMEELWAGLYEPSIYEANTLWKKVHDSAKIATVIDAWSKGEPLSPIFLVKHLSLDQGLVADGKHRLTVSRAIHASEVPFMVEATNAAWVSRAFPSALCIHQAQPSVPLDGHASAALRHGRE